MKTRLAHAFSATARFAHALNDVVGRAASWLCITMMLMQTGVLLLLFVFAEGSLWAQESIIYMHAALFMLSAGYTLRHDEHVRIDILYRDATPRRRALVDLVGSFVFLLPVCILILVTSLPYVAFSWRIGEGSREISGIQGVWLLKTLLPLFAIFLALQSLWVIAEAVRFLKSGKTTERP